MNQGGVRGGDRRPGPKLWCPNGCGNWVDNIGVPGPHGAVVVLLGTEPFCFCGVACASSFLEQMYLTIYEPSRLSPDVSALGLYGLLLNTLSEN